MSKELIGALIGLGGAILGALLGGAVSVYTLRQTQESETADEFRNVLEKIIDVRIKWNDAMRQYAKDPKALESIGQALNAKRQLYKSTATRILDRADHELTANDYATLAYEYASDSEYSSALRYYERAVKRTGEGKMERIAVLRSFGTLLLQPTPFRNRADAARYFHEALALTDDLTDDYSRYTTGYTHELFGFGLLYLSNTDPASREDTEWKKEIADARAHYETITVDQLRASALAGLDARLGGSLPPIPPPVPTQSSIDVGAPAPSATPTGR